MGKRKYDVKPENEAGQCRLGGSIQLLAPIKKHAEVCSRKQRHVTDSVESGSAAPDKGALQRCNFLCWKVKNSIKCMTHADSQAQHLLALADHLHEIRLAFFHRRYQDFLLPELCDEASVVLETLQHAIATTRLVAAQPAKVLGSRSVSCAIIADALISSFTHRSRRHLKPSLALTS
eukprot:3315513-Amphidinium_carterae.2